MFSALADDPDALARALRSQLPKSKTTKERIDSHVVTPVKKRSTRGQANRGKSDKEVARWRTRVMARMKKT